MTPDNIFYTYIYLDPRKFGVYEYGNYKFDAEPFYVGKGKDDRYLFYIHEAKSHSIKYVGNKHIYYKIKKILKVGLEPIILKIEENLFEQSALDLEIWTIWAIGRSDLKLGPLTNLTVGGDGLSGQILSDEHKRKLSVAHKGKNNPFFGHTHTAASIEIISKKSSKTYQVSFPDGHIEVISNLTKFSARNELKYSSFLNVLNKDKLYKGYRVKKIINY